MPTLNERAHELCDAMAADAASLGIAVSALPCGTRVIDCGVKAPGSIEAGLRLAEVCLSGRGTAEIDADNPASGGLRTVRVCTTEPVAACMASQYAGWELKGEKFFAMGSGPMRAAACREELFQHIGYCEKSSVCVGVLETGKLPPETICCDIAEKCAVPPNCLTLLAARTASAAGTLQIVARSVETALHKMHVLGLDLTRVVEGRGSAPMPPVAADDMSAIGWTNDAILYGAIVDLTMRGDDESLRSIGPRVPSSSSDDFGRPFAEIFAGYDHDFYRIDPMLFSPAVVRLHNVDSGNVFCFGQTAPDVLAQSFAKK